LHPHWPPYFARTRYIRPTFANPFSRTRYIRHSIHSPTFAKMWLAFDTFARVIRHFGEFGASGHCLLLNLESKQNNENMLFLRVKCMFKVSEYFWIAWSFEHRRGKLSFSSHSFRKHLQCSTWPNCNWRFVENYLIDTIFVRLIPSVLFRRSYSVGLIPSKMI
jgi:hypothetical protein